MSKIVLTLEYSDVEIARVDARFLSIFVSNLMSRDVLAERWSLTIDGLEFMPIMEDREFRGVSPETVRKLRGRRADEGH